MFAPDGSPTKSVVHTNPFKTALMFECWVHLVDIEPDESFQNGNVREQVETLVAMLQLRLKEAE